MLRFLRSNEITTTDECTARRQTSFTVVLFPALQPTEKAVGTRAPPVENPAT